MIIILDTFIKAIWVSCMALCLLSCFVSPILVIAYCPPKSHRYNSLKRSMLIGIKHLCAFTIPPLVWLYIAYSIYNLGDSILFDPTSFNQVYSNALQQIDEWGWLAKGLAAIFIGLWWYLTIVSSPNIMDRVRSKKPHPITTTKERIKAEILEIIGSLSPFILIAISPIIIFPLYMLIFGWLI